MGERGRAGLALTGLGVAVAALAAVAIVAACSAATGDGAASDGGSDGASDAAVGKPSFQYVFCDGGPEATFGAAPRCNYQGPASAQNVACSSTTASHEGDVCRGDGDSMALDGKYVRLSACSLYRCVGGVLQENVCYGFQGHFVDDAGRCVDSCATGYPIKGAACDEPGEPCPGPCGSYACIEGAIRQTSNLAVEGAACNFPESAGFCPGTSPCERYACIDGGFIRETTAGSLRVPGWLPDCAPGTPGTCGVSCPAPGARADSDASCTCDCTKPERYSAGTWTCSP